MKLGLKVVYLTELKKKDIIRICDKKYGRKGD
jgi:hypothetical protein